MSENTPVPTCPTCGAPLPANAPQGLCPKCLLLGVAAPTNPGDDAAVLHRPPPPALEAVATAFPQLEILALIGQGGMGCVFKARQPQLNRLVALKILPEALACDAAFADRFKREAQALAALNHPNIVTIHDFGQTGGFFYLLMEYVDGVNLRQALGGGRFTPEQALAIVPPLCDALQFAHERGIVHRDIKPENLLLDREGRIKIADFGIAKMIREQGPEIGQTESQPAGTPQYMAPEQKIAPRQVDSRADIYSLGMVFYEMLTGELPGDKWQPPSARLRGIQIDVRLDEIVLRALEQSPERRYQTVAELRTQVQTLTAPPATPPPPSPAPNASDTRILSAREQAWLARPESQRRLIRSLLLGLALLFTLNFTAPHFSVLGDGSTQTWTIGLTTPWFADIQHNFPGPVQAGVTIRNRETVIHPFRFSFLCGLLAIACWVVWHRIQRCEQGQALIRLVQAPDHATPKPKILWPNVLLAWVVVSALITIGMAFMIALIQLALGGAPSPLPTLLLGPFGAILVVGVSVLNGRKQLSLPDQRPPISPLAMTAAQISRGQSIPWIWIVLTVGLHGALWVILLVIINLLAPPLMELAQGFGVALPPITKVSVHLFLIHKKLVLVLFPMAILIDFTICVAIQSLGGTNWRRIWSVGLMLLSIATTILAYATIAWPVMNLGRQLGQPANKPQETKATEATPAESANVLRTLRYVRPFEVRLVLAGSTMESQEVQWAIPANDPQARPVTETLHLRTQPLLDETDVRHASVRTNPQTGGMEIEIEFTPAGARRFAEATRLYAGQRLAILVEGQVYSTPLVKQPITGNKCIITGNFTETDARRLAAVIAPRKQF